MYIYAEQPEILNKSIWFDNVQFEEVSATKILPSKRMLTIINGSSTPKEFKLQEQYIDNLGTNISSSVILEPKQTKILLKTGL